MKGGGRHSDGCPSARSKDTHSTLTCSTGGMVARVLGWTLTCIQPVRAKSPEETKDAEWWKRGRVTPRRRVEEAERKNWALACGVIGVMIIGSSPTWCFGSANHQKATRPAQILFWEARNVALQLCSPSALLVFDGERPNTASLQTIAVHGNTYESRPAAVKDGCTLMQPQRRDYHVPAVRCSSDNFYERQVDAKHSGSFLFGQSYLRIVACLLFQLYTCSDPNQGHPSKQTLQTKHPLSCRPSLHPHTHISSASST